MCAREHACNKCLFNHDGGCKCADACSAASANARWAYMRTSTPAYTVMLTCTRGDARTNGSAAHE
eukprot:8511213-Alexandrium_andersonii.AAC.1